MNENPFDLPSLIDDGLFTSEIKQHSLEKYRAISYFLKIFSTSMKSSWDNRVYIDLFSGSGRSRVEGEDKIVPGSPLLALGVEDRFDKYIFCEKEPVLCNILHKRISTICEPEKFAVIQGDANHNLAQIIKEMPEFKKGKTCLSFCLVDPFGISDIKFETIQYLATKLIVDFLVLIATNMDARRNESLYVDPGEMAVDNFLGDTNWRIEWEKRRETTNFGIFILNYFCEKMKKLGYVYKGPEDTMPIMLKEKNFALYHLMLFSRKPIGYRFWVDTKKNINPKTSFNFKENNG